MGRHFTTFTDIWPTSFTAHTSTQAFGCSDGFSGQKMTVLVTKKKKTKTFITKSYIENSALPRSYRFLQLANLLPELAVPSVSHIAAVSRGHFLTICTVCFSKFQFSSDWAEALPWTEGACCSLTQRMAKHCPIICSLSPFPVILGRESGIKKSRTCGLR